MELKSEKIVVDNAGTLESESGATVDHKLASGGFYIPQITTAALPTASTHEGMLVYDTTANCLKYSDGTNWKQVTVEA